MSEKKTNILHLQNFLNLSCGVSRTIYSIAKNTSSAYSHQVFCLGGDGFSRFLSINVKPISLKYYNNYVTSFCIHYVKIYSYCKQCKIDIIHSHHRYFDLIAFFISLTLKIKTVTSVHSKTFNRRLFSYKANYFIACSSVIKNQLIDIYKIDPKKIKIIHNHADPKEVKLTKSNYDLKELLQISKDNIVIGYIGRLDFIDKGVDVLLNAFLELYKHNKNFFLLLIGKGNDANKTIEFITQNNLNAKVVNSQADIYNYYQLLDLFVLSSRVDSFPLTMLEAGLMKVPFIGSDVDGISELIEHEKDGLLFESENVSDLVQQILRIMNDKQLAESLSENLYQKIITSYTVDKIVPQYEALYSELLIE